MNTSVSLIDDIYNYCDTWCERCLFTQRCRSFQIQSEMGLTKSMDSGQNLVQQLTEALSLTREYINNLTQAESAVSADEPLQSLEEKVVRQPQSQVHLLSQLANEYLQKTGVWLNDEKKLLEQAGRQQIREVELGLRTQEEAMPLLHGLYDAWEMIRWYRTLIPVKTQSAIRILAQPTDDTKLMVYHLGKAKLVLVSIDRSLMAWQTLLTNHPEKMDDMLDMLSLLSRLRREMESQFPQAREFQRPGLD